MGLSDAKSGESRPQFRPSAARTAESAFDGCLVWKHVLTRVCARPHWQTL